MLVEIVWDKPKRAINKARHGFDFGDLTEGFFFEATIHVAKSQRRGWPKLDRPKEQVSLGPSAEVLDYFRKDGAGWQARIDATLREVVKKAG